MAILRLAGAELGQADPPLAFWAFAWPGGLGLARYVLDHPAEVAGRRVVDVGTGSGLCAIAAAHAGAADVLGLDVDPLAEAAFGLNVRANGLSLGFRGEDPLDGPPPACDVILAGDVAYEGPLAERMMAWLRVAAGAGARVLLGDPGRRYLPEGLVRLATYEVPTTRETEAAERTTVGVFTL